MNQKIRRLLIGFSAGLLPLFVLNLLAAGVDGGSGLRGPTWSGAGIAAATDRIDREKPEVIIIGSSVVGWGVSARDFERHSGLQPLILSNRGAASAKWYLMIKNAVLKAAHRPKAIVLVFRDDFLTRPSFRTTGVYKEKIDRFAGPDEPLLDRLAYSRGEGDLVATFFPIERSRDAIRARFEAFARGLIPAVAGDELNGILNAAFGEAGKVERLVNQSQLDAEELYVDQLESFEQNVPESFLPAITDLAREDGTPLILVRYKRRRDAEGRPRHPELRGYIDQLDGWLEEQGVPFVDFTDDPRLTLSHWGPGDHLNKKRGKPLFSRLLAEAVTPLIQ